MKTYVLTVSKSFLKGHPKEGQQTDFHNKIVTGVKIHTIRGNYAHWEKVVDEVNSGLAILSIRQWSIKPYRSPQQEILQLNKLGIQKIDLYGPERDNRWFVLGEKGWVSDKTSDIAANDGLSLDDFKGWFTKSAIGAAIIHFTDFRY
jgi:hypothetical protein